MCYNINKVPDTKLRLRERMRIEGNDRAPFWRDLGYYAASCWDAVFCIVRLKERYSLKFKDSGKGNGDKSSGYEYNR